MKKNAKFIIVFVACILISTLMVSVVSAAECSHPITTDPNRQVQPSIYGDIIVWSDNRSGKYDIYMYDLSTQTETPLIIAPSLQLAPSIYEDIIIWSDWRNGNMEIYMYDLSTQTETPIITDMVLQQGRFPIYEDRIVWVDLIPGGTPNVDRTEIYMYDISTQSKTQITTDLAVGPSSPSIYGNKIVWGDHRNGATNSDIYMYDLGPDGEYGTGDDSGEIQITTSLANQGQPSIHGNRIVWDDHRIGSAGWDIYMYDLGPDGIYNSSDDVGESRITSDPADQLSPSIYGDRIIWKDERNGLTDHLGRIIPDIYMYNIDTGIETSISTDQSWPSSYQIYEDIIIWRDDRSGNPDIYISRETEICNGIDDDCDGSFDEDFDADGDTYTTCGTSTITGASVTPDCDDTDEYAYPGATEVCNGVNDNCDGQTDESCVIGCRSIILSSGLVTLDSNLGNCQGYGIRIEADNVVLDCQGYYIDGDYMPGSSIIETGIILTNSNNVEIKDCNIINFHTGIYLSGSDLNTITSNEFRQNDIGIELKQSSGNNITSNTIETIFQTSTSKGIYLDDHSMENEISSNNVSGNHQYGIHLNYISWGNNIISNIVNDNYYGIYLNLSAGNIISSNNIYSNQYGIYTDSSSTTEISSNTVSNNHYGIRMGGSGGASRINNNDFSDNTINAIDEMLVGLNTWYSSIDCGSGMLNIIEGDCMGGNSWHDYAGIDDDFNGIGDTDYIIGVTHDRYPLTALGAGTACYNGDGDGDGFCADFRGGDDCDDGDVSVNPAAADICNGINDDCNTGTEDGVGEPTPFNTKHPNGVCSGSYQSCTGGGWQDDYTEVPNYEPVETLCDGFDNDCDGYIDNILGTSADNTLTQSCGTGLCEGDRTCTADVGSGVESWSDCSTKDWDCELSCAICDADGGCTVYDETQDNDCPATVCDDSCFVTPDNWDLTWDSAVDVPNQCLALDACSQNLCSYTHTCSIDVCGAGCEVNLDCINKCDGDIWSYSGICNDVSACTCSYTEQTCDTAELTANTCYYDAGGDGYCKPSGCERESVECPDYCIDDDDGGPCATTNHDIDTAQDCHFTNECTGSGCTLTASLPLREDYCDVCTDSGVQPGDVLCPAPDISCIGNCPESGKYYYDSTPGDRTDDCSSTMCNIDSCDMAFGDVFDPATGCACDNTECSNDCQAIVGESYTSGTCVGGACNCAPSEFTLAHNPEPVEAGTSLDFTVTSTSTQLDYEGDPLSMSLCGDSTCASALDNLDIDCGSDIDGSLQTAGCTRPSPDCEYHAGLPYWIDLTDTVSQQSYTEGGSDIYTARMGYDCSGCNAFGGDESCYGDGVCDTTEDKCISCNGAFEEQDGECEEECGADPLCDERSVGYLLTTCASGQTYYEDKCSTGCALEDDNICRGSTYGTGDCTASSFCDGNQVGHNDQLSDECCHGACEVLDCDDFDDTDPLDLILKESEVSSSSCISGCSEQGCCDIQTAECNEANVCDSVSTLISNLDDILDYTCYNDDGMYKWLLTPPADVCNGINDDCNGGTLDGSGEPAPDNSVQHGVCLDSTQTCNDGIWDDDYNGVTDYELVETSCDGLDNDCDNYIDAATPGAQPDMDDDGDNYCDVNNGGNDCDDTVFSCNTGIADCSILAYFDDDGDGYGDPAISDRACDGILPGYYLTDDSDCDDDAGDDPLECSDPELDCTLIKYSGCAVCINPEAIEVCDNGVDDNCDGEDTLDLDCQPNNRIKTCLQLQMMGGFGSYQLMNNIDCTAFDFADDGKGFMPIGTNSIPFKGTFDGNGFKIIGLYINRPLKDYVGLFGYTNVDSELVIISNVGLEDVDITGESYVGGLVGYAKGTSIQNSYTTGTVTGTGGVIGGLVGRIMISGVISNIINSYSNSSVSCGGSVCGGLVGYNDGSIDYSYATGTVTSGGGDVGGLVGSLYRGTIANSYFIPSAGGVAVSGTGSSVGGLVGTSSSYLNEISNSNASGFTVYAGGGSVGGFIGRNRAYIHDSFISNITVISPPGETYIGGFVGHSQGTSTLIENSHAIDINVSAGDGLVSSNKVGGFVGRHYQGTIRGSSVTGYIKGYEEVGGFVGMNRNAFIYDSSNLDATVYGYSKVGGFVGYNYGSSIIGGSSVIGDVEGHYEVGGFLGYNSPTASIDSSNSNITVVSWYSESIGGFGGYNQGSISNSYAEGSVSSPNGTGVGGMIGYNDVSGTVSNSYTTVNIIGNDPVGGAIGTNLGTITNSFSVSSSTGNNNVGALVGYDSGNTIINGYWYDDPGDSASSCVGNQAHTCDSNVQTDITYFYNSNNAPLDAWDFVDTWEETPGSLPGFVSCKSRVCDLNDGPVMGDPYCVGYCIS